MKKKTKEEFLEELTAELERTGDLNKYDLSKVEYINAKNKVVIICNIHGDKLVSPFHLLNGRRCGECKGTKLSNTLRADWVEVKSKATLLHEGKYSYDKFEYTNNQTKGIITCVEHGDFLMDMTHHIGRGQGCKECNLSRAKYETEDLVDTFLEKATKVHEGRYSYNNVGYKTCKDPVLVTCLKHGDYHVTPDNHINAFSGCPLCSHKVSLSELELAEFIRGLGLEILCNKPLLGKRHIDIFIPSLRIGVEYCGLYFHSDKFRSYNYHRSKFLEAKKEGISLLQVFEDEWLHKKEIVKNVLLSKLGKLPKIAGARELEFKEVPNSLARTFYDSNHLQGGGTAIGNSYGLYQESTLVSCMSFSSSNVDIGTTELIRFASLGRIPGGFSKILSNAIPYLKESGKKKIISFSDNRWSDGNMYNINGFKLSGVSAPRYWWTKNQTKFHRRLFQRKYLSEKLSVFDENLSEAENCITNGYLKIHDAGVSKWELEI